MTLLPVLALGLVSASQSFHTDTVFDRFDHLTSGSITFTCIGAYQTTLGGSGMTAFMDLTTSEAETTVAPGSYLSEYVILTMKGASNVPTGSTVTGMSFNVTVSSTGANDGTFGDPDNPNVVQLYDGGLVGTNEAGGHTAGIMMKEWDYGSSTTTWGEDPPRRSSFLIRQNWKHSAAIISGSSGGLPTFQIAFRYSFNDSLAFPHSILGVSKYGATLYYD